MPQLPQTPTTIVTGFLGSGKTTIIGHLIEHLQSQGQQVVYIKNEIGQEDLDAKLMQGQDIVSKELLNGCICCTLVGPFVSAIEEVIQTYHPDRIIIESAGTADPAALALMVANHPLLLRDGVISIIDVVNFDGYDDISEPARRQAKLTDLIVFNKVELVDLQRKQAVVGYVRELNEYSPIVEAPEGRLDPQVAVGIDSQLDTAQLEAQVTTEHDHEDDDQILAVTLVFDQPLDQICLDQALEKLPKNVFRVKGYVQLAGLGWRVLNGVFKRFEYLEVEKPQTIVQTRLICIGYQLEEQQPELEALIGACQKS